MSELQDLLKKYKHFRTQQYDANIKSHQELVSKHNPKTIIITCSDARVDPAILLQTKIGDAFTIRNVANIVPPYFKNSDSSVQAALEYALSSFKVSDIVLLGHSQCAGIAHCLSQKKKPKENTKKSFLDTWIDHIQHFHVPEHFSKQEEVKFYEEEALKYSYQNLLEYPFVEEKINEGSLKCHAWYLSLKEYHLYALSEDNEFKSLL